MRNYFVIGTMCTAGASVSCGKRDHNKNDNPPPVKAKDLDGSITVVQVNSKAFNAFNIWSEGQGSEILDYPQDYNLRSGRTTSDGVFFEGLASYKFNGKFIGVPTVEQR